MAMDEEELAVAIATLLDEHTVMTLATVDDSGPHAASLMFARDHLTLYWLSDPKVRHSQHIEPEAFVAVTVAGQYEDFREIRGLQMSGTAGRLEGGEEESKAFDGLQARYPFLQSFALGTLASHMGAAAIYAFRPRTITLIDNRRRFGFKETLELPPYAVK